MLLYLFLGIVVCLFAYLNKYKGAESGLLISFFTIFIFSAIRYDFGNDYQSYLEIYRDITSNLKSSLSGYSRYEFGWVLLNIIFCKTSFESIIFFTSLVNSIFFYNYIKKYVSPNYYLLAIIIYYFDANIFLISLSAIRQSISILLILISIDYLNSKKIVLFIIAFIAAINFHFSSLILLPILVFFNWSNNRINLKYIVFFLVIFFSFFLLKDILKEYLIVVTVLFFENRYGTLESDASMNILNFIAYLTILIFMFISHNKLDKRFQYFSKLLMFGIVIIPIDFILPLAGRLSYYFLTLSVIVFPKIFAVLNNLFLKYLFLLIIVLILIIRLFNFFTSDTYSIGYGTYKTIFYH